MEGEVRLSQQRESSPVSWCLIRLLLDASPESTEQAAVQEEDGSSEGEEEWIIQRYGRHRGQHTGESVKLSRLAPSPTPRSGKAVKP